MSQAITFTELTGGQGHSIMSATPGPDLARHGYTETEYSARGVARRFATVDDTATGIEEAGTAPFVTRILVRRPAADSAFDGHVVVEWFNVSSGNDSAPEYTYLAPEIIRAGSAWVGVSAQYTGIAGGPDSVDLETTGTGAAGVSQQGLAANDPDRYGELSHPGDAYCYDIFGTVTKALRDNGSVGHPLSGLSVRRVIAAGESQSAMALTTYVNVFTRVHHAIDGALIHSRPVGALPADPDSPAVDISSAYHGAPAPISADCGIPVFVVQTETDVLTDFDYVRARQPDSEVLRVWEVAGSSHADIVQIGEYEHLLGCPNPVNRGQQVFVLRAALHHLRGWIDEGVSPPTAEPLAVLLDRTPPGYALDEAGNVRGGVRTPCVDVPTEVLSGVLTGDAPRICVLFGSTTVMSEDALRQRYTDPDDYLHQYVAATDTAIGRGMILPADRTAVLADARPDPIPTESE